MSEILTFQSGTLAHHLMAHFWNLQNEYLKDQESSFIDPRSLYYERADGQYTPRALLCDLKPNFAALRKVFVKEESIEAQVAAAQ